MSQYNFIEWIKYLKISPRNNIWSYLAIKGVILLYFKDIRKKSKVNKENILKTICKYFNPNLNIIRNKLNEIEDALQTNGYVVKVCRIKALTRALIGSSESFGQIPFEVGLFFDPILNVPFIPGSSIKGAVRNALEELIIEDCRSKGLSPEECKKEAEEIAGGIMGSNDVAGLIGFTDAYPVKLGERNLLFEPDILTPHYPGARTEFDVKPNPVPFLTIARGVEFQFYVYFNKRLYELEHNYLKKTRRKYVKIGVAKQLDKVGKGYVDYATFGGNLVKVVEEYKKSKGREIDISSILPWIDRAILYAFIKGVGAKTSLGYSRFKIIGYEMIG